jgi:enoyl-CoA hydratase/carnithine racemase
MADRILIDVTDGVADVRLNRADKMNALDTAMFEALSNTGRTLASRRDVRAVVLSGEGRGFSAGLDFTSFAAMAGAAGAERPTRNLFDRAPGSIANHAQHAGWVWQELPMPVIAAVHGVAYGGGLQIALGADIRLVAPDAKLSVMEIKWGLVPDMSGTQTLRHLVRLDVAKELTFSGRIVSGTEAVALGLATRVADDPRAAALALAAEIASKSPSAVRAAKQLLNASVSVDAAEGLALEQQLQAGLLGRPNQIEAVRSNLEKRAPHWADPE